MLCHSRRLCQLALQARAGRIDQQQWQLQFDEQNLFVQGDPLLLEQAIGHLLDNALDFAPQSAKVELKIQLKVERHSSKNVEKIELILCNQGPHIPEYACLV